MVRLCSKTLSKPIGWELAAGLAQLPLGKSRKTYLRSCGSSCAQRGLRIAVKLCKIWVPLGAAEFSGVMELNTAKRTIQVGLGFLTTVLSLTSAAVAADDVSLFRLQSLPATTRTITTYGNAEVLVVPDKVNIIFAVKTFEKTLDVATTANNRSVKNIMALASKYDIKPVDLQTTEVSVTPIYPEGEHSYTSTPVSKPVGYSVEQSIGFVIYKVENSSALMQDALAAGANSIKSVTFETTELRKHRDEARLQAIRAAKQKGEAFAVESGLKLGKPLHIQEEPGSGYQQSYMNMSQNSISSRDSGSGESAASLALGRLHITAEVRATYEME